MRSMFLPASTEDWSRVLMECGVATGASARLAPTFAATIREDTFSAGLARELPDFLTTLLHESRFLERLRESGRYSARRIREVAGHSPAGSRWASLYGRADELAGNERAFFEALYGGRFGNGPEGSGDGARYPGRAYIGLTFRDNYAWVGDAVGQDLLVTPELAEQPTFALEFTVAWWEGHVPDRVMGDERKVRKVVNGGYIGMEEVARIANLVRGVLQC